MKEPFRPHLQAERVCVPAGGEWRPTGEGWWMWRLESGGGYLMQPDSNHQLEPGVVIRLAANHPARILASQLSAIELRGFRVDVTQLPGLLSPCEERFFGAAEKREELACKIFTDVHPIARASNDLLWSDESDLSFRISAVQLFARSFLEKLPVSHAGPTLATNDAAARVKRMLKATPSAELIHLSVRELVEKVQCTPRHFSRIFRGLVGVSFREKQVQIRLDRATHLLSRTDSKVVDVAFESGFGSVSLFNVLFKRRFQVGPREWRNMQRRTRTAIRPLMGRRATN